MTVVSDILRAMNDLAPAYMAENTDNVGQLFGAADTEVKRVFIALDITARVIEEARDFGAQVIIAHHPILWNVKNITDKTATGKRLLMLGSYGIAAICMHTNLDSAEGGINTVLADIAGLTNERFFVREGGRTLENRPYGLGIYGELPRERHVAEFASDIGDKLGCKSLRYLDTGKPVRKLAVGSGKCTMIFDEVTALGCDTFLTGDITHSFWLEAQDMGVNLIDAGHFPTENIVCGIVLEHMTPLFSDVEFAVSKRHDEPFTVL